MTPDTGIEPESATGDRLPPAGVRWATVAQVVAIVAGVIAMACELLMWRNLGETMWNSATGASFVPEWFTGPRELLSVAPAGAGVLAAVAGLALKKPTTTGSTSRRTRPTNWTSPILLAAACGDPFCEGMAGGIKFLDALNLAWGVGQRQALAESFLE